MGTISTIHHPDRWWIKAKGEVLIRTCIGEVDDYNTSPLFTTMTIDEFEKRTGRKIIDEPVFNEGD